MSVENQNNIVYDRLVVPVGLHYYGITNNLSVRNRLGYKRSSLQPYIDTYGWNNIKTTVIAEGLTRKEAEQLEGLFIKEGWKKGNCINQQGSGGEWRDNPKDKQQEYKEQHKNSIQVYMKQYRKENIEKLTEKDRKRYIEKHSEILEQKKEYYQEHKEERLTYSKEYRQKNREILSKKNKDYRNTPEHIIYERVHSYNRYHPDNKLITPAEAKEMYLLTGYIPDFIKKDGIC